MLYDDSLQLTVARYPPKDSRVVVCSCRVCFHSFAHFYHYFLRNPPQNYVSMKKNLILMRERALKRLVVFPLKHGVVIFSGTKKLVVYHLPLEHVLAVRT